jgi:putative transposase
LNDSFIQPHRRSIRLPGYDYSQPGAYFITIVTYQRQHLFGNITDGIMISNPCGQIAAAEWCKTSQLRTYIELFPDEFVVMPNHIHGIFHFKSDTPSIGPALPRNAPTKQSTTAQPPAPHSLAAVVRAYKSAVTYAINTQNDSRGFPIWQRNYFEHIIRSEKEYLQIQAYIENNPANWVTDREDF